MSNSDLITVARVALDSLSLVVAPALAIVLFTMAVRLLISPLTYLQVRNGKRTAALAPEVAKLREKHGDDPMTLATETLALQRANGVSPFTTLLPALAQAPFFMLMYHLVQPGAGAPGGVLAGQLFGVPLTAHLGAGLPVFALLLALATALAWWSARRMQATMPADTPGVGLFKWMPYLGVAAVAWMPLAGGLYLVTSTAWTALEQLVLRR
jgi:YidC/Oxa1 family membrane protein insertase